MFVTIPSPKFKLFTKKILLCFLENVSGRNILAIIIIFQSVRPVVYNRFWHFATFVTPITILYIKTHSFIVRLCVYSAPLSWNLPIFFPEQFQSGVFSFVQTKSSPFFKVLFNCYIFWNKEYKDLEFVEEKSFYIIGKRWCF